MSKLPDSFISRPTTYARRKRLVRRLVVYCCIVVATLAWLRYFTGFGVIWSFAQIESHVKSRMTGDALQQWALEVMKQSRTEDALSSLEVQPPLPKALLNAYRRPPQVTVFTGTDNNPGHVRIMWGGGFIGHCAFEVGPTNFSKGAGHKWQDGIYFWFQP